MKKYLLFLILYIAFPVVTFSAGSELLKVSSDRNNLSIGEDFSVYVSVVSPDQAMNAVSGSITFSDNLQFLGIDKTSSLVDFWTQDPKIISNKVIFEGIILNPGYIGKNGSLFKIKFVTKKSGTASVYLSDGAILANDGFGTNILDSLGKTSINILKQNYGGNVSTISPDLSDGVALPVITEYSESVLSKESVFVRGLGEPNAMTKIVFKDVSFKSVGERFIDFVQSNKKKLDEVLVRNTEDGTFEYVTSQNLVAGVYNATPFLVDENTKTERPGFGVQLLVNDSKIVKNLVVVINILALLIPVVGLIVIIYFIPWYSFKRMRILRKKMGFEEEEIEVAEHRLKKEENML